VRVLFVASHPPLPRDNGGRLRTFHLLDELSKRAQVTLITLDQEPGAPAPRVTAAEIEQALPKLTSVRTVPAPAGNRRAIQLQALLTRTSYTMRLHRSPELDEAVTRALDDKPDLVHCDSLFCAQVHRPGNTWVLSLHNAESLLKRRLAAVSTGSRKLLYNAEATALAKLERHYATAFDHVVTVSDKERELFARLNPSTVTIPNGVGPRPQPKPRSPHDPLRLLFVGSLNYEPNREGLEWFAREVLPRVEAEVEAVGPGRRGPELPGITYLGRVEDLEPVYARADAAIVPLRAGAGSRLKVLEALALGVPLISTTLGAEGYDLTDGENALLAEDADAFVERLQRVRDLAPKLVTNGYAFAKPYFWPAIGERLAGTYEAWSDSTAAHSP
jgi:glycosyltransferase involved in cell wall biosynthesis